MVFQQNLLENAYFIAKMPGLAMVRPASSDLWKAPWVSGVSGGKGKDGSEKGRELPPPPSKIVSPLAP